VTAARVLIIAHGAPAVDVGCENFLPSGEGYERKFWENFVPETLLHSSARLILALASPSTEKVARFFQWLLHNPIHIPTVAILPETPDPASLQAIAAVSDDFIFMPIREQELELRIKRIIGSRAEARERTHEALQQQMGLRNLVGTHVSFLHAVEKVPLFAASHAPVLITGETGTGKELFAHAIHSLSQRRNGPFIPVDCGSLPEHLTENELFGHCRGAFTDAHTEQKGLVGMANGGTLFLDEIDALSSANQAKLLRFLQEGTYRQLGADSFSRSNARIVAATNRNIEQCVEQRVFRSDLYFRLNVLRLELPALRQRHGDVSLLARHFLESQCSGAQTQGKFFAPAALRKLESYHWPGNARELLNTVQRAAVCSGRHQITAEDIALSQEANDAELASAGGKFQSAKQHTIEKFERSYIEELLTRHGGNVTQAAREAGKERRAFGRLIKKYGIGSQRCHPGSF
jgi:DNA-binding NtrC family response regulator